jgi:hypothetical protein
LIALSIELSGIKYEGREREKEKTIFSFEDWE